MTFEEWWAVQSKPLSGTTKDKVKVAWDVANKTNVWKRALDNELVLWGKLTPEEATFKEAMDTLRTLLLITQSVATDPLVNGGYVLVPVEPTEKMIDAFWNVVQVGNEARPSDIYKAMIQAAREEE